MEEKIIKLLMKIIGRSNSIENLTENTNLLESGLLDSLGIAELVAGLEEIFLIDEIDGEDIVPDNFENVSAIANLIRGYKGDGDQL